MIDHAAAAARLEQNVNKLLDRIKQQKRKIYKQDEDNERLRDALSSVRNITLEEAAMKIGERTGYDFEVGDLVETIRALKENSP